MIAADNSACVITVAHDTTVAMETHLRLRSWLDAANIIPAEMARRVGWHRGNFHKILTGQRIPPLIIAARIERETGGAILASAWVKA